MKLIILLGIHGAGKGEQMKLLLGGKYLDDVITSSEAFRKFNDPNSRYHVYQSLVLPYEHLMAEGKYIPDEVVTEIVKSEIKKDKEKWFKAVGLDGFPRSLDQAKSLLNIAQELGDLELQFIYLKLSDEVALKRLAERASHEKRETDTVNQQRIVLYHEVTDPMIAYLREKGLVTDVDDLPPIETVHKAITQIIK